MNLRTFRYFLHDIILAGEPCLKKFQSEMFCNKVRENKLGKNNRHTIAGCFCCLDKATHLRGLRFFVFFYARLGRAVFSLLFLDFEYVPLTFSNSL